MYIDINWEARTNGRFRHKLDSLISEIGRLEKINSPAAEDKIKNLTVEIYRHCHHNPGFLIPYFFPKFHPTVPHPTPLSLQDRPYAFAIFYFQIGGFIVFRASRQIGKMAAVTEPVLTPKGWVPIGEIKVGDKVFDEEGNPTKVKAIHPQGVQPSYKVTFNDDSFTYCGNKHLWKCKKNKSNTWTVKTLKEIREIDGDTPRPSKAVRIPLCEPIKFRKKKHIIKPYTLGVLIGDGSITKGNMKVTSADAEIIDNVSKIQQDIKFTEMHKYNYFICTYNADTPPRDRSPFRQDLERMNLRVRAENKHIPEEYLYDSVENRTELLRGLMDTDGTIYGKCQMEYYTVSKKLAEQVQFLVQSLGGKARVRTKPAWYKDDDGNRVDCRECYRVKINIKDINPFKLKRKADQFYNIHTTRQRILRKVEYVEDVESVCIEVESPHHTYITRNCIVTHNSTSIAARQLVNAHIIHKYKSLYITPHQEFLNTYANRLKDMEREFRFTRSSPDLRNNLKYKENDNGSTISLVKCLTDSAEARSKTSDELLYDEYQLLDPELEPDIEQTQKSSFMPSTVYAGTSTTIASPLETRYQESSKATWHIKSPDGKHWINCGDEEEILSVIQPNGPTCPYSGQLLDVTKGTFVHEDERAMLDNQIGFHIPQIIIPQYAHDMVKWREIYKVYKKYDHKKFLQEVLGIPTEEGSREITEADLRAMCCLPEKPETLRKKACSHYYRHVISGCDWGGSDYNPADKTKASYTVHVIIGITQDWKIHILHIKQYSGMDYRSISEDIMKNHVNHEGNALAADFGVGGAYNMLIRESKKININRHLIIQYVGPNASPLSKPPNSALFNHWTLNRTESITELFRAIKEGEILCFPWEEAEDHLMELLNMFRIPTESAAGVTGFRYQKHGARPDDTLHALNFAYVVARLYMKHPLMHDRELESTLYRHLGIQGGTGGDSLGGWPNCGHISG